MAYRYCSLNREAEKYWKIAHQLSYRQPDNSSELHYFRELGGRLAAPSPFDSLFVNRSLFGPIGPRNTVPAARASAYP